MATVTILKKIPLAKWPIIQLFHIFEWVWNLTLLFNDLYSHVNVGGEGKIYLFHFLNENSIFLERIIPAGSIFCTLYFCYNSSNLHSTRSLLFKEYSIYNFKINSRAISDQKIISSFFFLNIFRCCFSHDLTNTPNL